MDREIASKLSLRFAKIGSAAFFSHHDLMRYFERLLRRAELPVRLTAGFNPKPRMVFPHALAVGVESACEELEIEFSGAVSAAAALEALRREAGGVVDLLGVTELPPVKAGRRVRSCTYALRGFSDAEVAVAAAAALRGAEKALAERGHAEKKTVDIKAYLLDISANGAILLVKLAHFDSGAGRIDEVANWIERNLGLEGGCLAAAKVAMDVQ